MCSWILGGNMEILYSYIQESIKTLIKNTFIF